MSYRIEQDASTERGRFGEYTYLIYERDRLIARYWHDHRGDDHGIEFTDGRRESRPVGTMSEFVDGGGPEPLRLSERALAFLNESLGKAPEASARLPQSAGRFR